MLYGRSAIARRKTGVLEERPMARPAPSRGIERDESRSNRNSIRPRRKCRFGARRQPPPGICPPFAAGFRRRPFPQAKEEPMAGEADIGVLGLAVMGANLARNAARHGFGVAVFNRNPERTDALIAEHGGEGRFFPSKTLPEFIASIKKPRPILIMVKAGPPVDQVIDELLPHLEQNDIIIDGGNSLFTDTARRYETCEAKKIRFVGMGV